jgi:hypothetical protein
MEGKLIPFAKECLVDRLNNIIKEENAPSPSHWYVLRAYKLQDIQRLVWPGNSPDLMPIEKGWPWIKKRTTARGSPPTVNAVEDSWLTN